MDGEGGTCSHSRKQWALESSSSGHQVVLSDKGSGCIFHPFSVPASMGCGGGEAEEPLTYPHPGGFSLVDDESPGLYGFLHVIVHSAKGFKQSASKCL